VASPGVEQFGKWHKEKTQALQQAEQCLQAVLHAWRLRLHALPSVNLFVQFKSSSPVAFDPFIGPYWMYATGEELLGVESTSLFS